MNFAMFFVCVLLAIKTEARTTTEEDTLSIITTIKTVLENITTLITKISAQLPALITNVKDTLKDIVAQIPPLLATLQKEIEEVLEEGMKCMKEYTFDPAGLYKCLSEQVQPLMPVLQELGEEVVNVYVVVKEEGGDAMYEIVEGVGNGGRKVDAKLIAE